MGRGIVVCVLLLLTGESGCVGVCGLLPSVVVRTHTCWRLNWRLCRGHHHGHGHINLDMFLVITRLEELDEPGY